MPSPVHVRLKRIKMADNPRINAPIAMMTAGRFADPLRRGIWEFILRGGRFSEADKDLCKGGAC